MADTKKIEHLGIIEDIQNESITVRISNQSACSACHAKTVCGMADQKNKQIQISNTIGQYNPGEEVLVELKQSLGLRAVFLAYVLPFIILLSLLISFNAFGMHELIAGLISLASLLPYFTIVYFFRKKLNKTFTFALKKLE